MLEKAGIWKFSRILFNLLVVEVTW